MADFEFTAELEADLLETDALDAADVATLRDAAADEPLGNWSADRYRALKGFGPAKAFVAHAVVRRHLASQGIEVVERTQIPERPPYLDGPGDYDPRDPTQFWTSKTGEMFRWDGKGVVHPVTVVRHYQVGEVFIPDRDEVTRAIKAGLDWFHHGYGTYRGWIGRGGKPYFTHTSADRQRVLLAKQQLESGAPV